MATGKLDVDVPTGTIANLFGEDASGYGVKQAVTSLEDTVAAATTGTPSGNDRFIYFLDSNGNLRAITYSNLVTVLDGDLAGGSGIADGDKGDITVSSSGTVWTVDNDVVTYAKMQNVSATSRILGRKTSGSGDAEELTASEVLTFISSTQGNILYYNGTAWVALAPGTANYVLRSGGAGANVSWSASGGSWETVSTWNGTPAANVDFTGLDIYTDLFLTLEDVTLASSGIRNLVVGTGAGPTYHNSSGNYQTLSSAGAKSSASLAAGHSTGTTSARTTGFKISGSNLSGGASKIIELTNSNGSTMFVANTDPITALRVTVDGSINISGGSIILKGRRA